jgi:hypothetical protein
VLRHGRGEASRRLLDGTLRNCIAMNAEDRFDAALTERWADRVADCVEADAGPTFEAFMARHPDLRQGDLLGVPGWKRDVPPDRL